MGVFDGQPVSAAITNPAFLDANADDVALGVIGFQNTTNVNSGPFVNNIQRAANTLFTTTGATESVAGTVYGAPASTILNGDSHQSALTKLANKFHPSTGHKHTGAAGDAPNISALDLSNVPLQGKLKQGTDLIGIAGSSTDVSATMGGETSSAGPTSTGVVTTFPDNKVALLYSTGSNAFDEIVDSSGNQVFGRLSYAASVWTLSFFSIIGVTETAYTIPSSINIRWFYQKLYNPMAAGWPVYSEILSIPSENVTADVIIANTAAYGKVILNNGTSTSVGTVNDKGTTNANVANSDHIHQGVHSVQSDVLGQLYGDVTFSGTGGTVTTTSGQTITIDSPALASTTPAEIAATGAIGVGTTSARADHVHKGMHSLAFSGALYGDVTLTGSGGTTLSQVSQNIDVASPALSSSAAASVGSANTVGVGTTTARADHVHQGVHSLASFGNPALYGDTTLSAGSNVTLTQVGNNIAIAASTGGGGSGGIDANGNGDFTLRPTTAQWFITSPDTTLWEVTVTNAGVLQTTSGGAGPASGFQMARDDSTLVSFAITNAGILQVIDPSAGGTTNNALYLQAPDGTAWQIRVNNLDQLYTSSNNTIVNYWRLKSDAGQTLFQVQESNGLALLYTTVFSAATLPATPTAITGTLPFTFYDNGSAKKLIYWNGSVWKYVVDDSNV